MVITNIEKFRRAFPMTKTELASRVGVSCMAVSQWESGKTKPGTEAAVKLTQIFHCDLQKIMDTEDLGRFCRSEADEQAAQGITDGWED